MAEPPHPNPPLHFDFVKMEGRDFATMAKLARRGLFGTAGDGKQYVSWVHEQDFVRALDWIIDHEDLGGAINISAPNPLPNREFSQILREAVGARLSLPMMNWMLEVGALFMKTETELILKSRRVVPTRLLESGFTFDFPDREGAAKDLAAAWMNQAAHKSE